MVQITLVKLVPAQSCICGFEFIQRVQFLWFFRIEEELLCKVQSWSGNFVLAPAVTRVKVLRSEDILHFT